MANIMTIEQNISKNITTKNNNLSILKQHFSHCFDKNGNFDLQKFAQEIVQEVASEENNSINFSKESYGMDWLGKSYARILATDSAKTFLKENTEWNNKKENQNSENILIKGDNLEVLKHLSNAYYQKVKMIYIDPPYNTGNDGFIYEDDRKFSPYRFKELAGISLEQAKKVLSFVNSKSNSHSAWLTFMYPRLYIAKQLLKDDGVIFVSIDDNEVAQLKILMDEIFGEENFVGDIIRKTKSQTNDTKSGLNYQHEFVLVYAKFIDNVLLQGNDKDFSNYQNPDNDPMGSWASSDPSARSGNNNALFEIKNPFTGTVDLPPKGRYWAFAKSTFEKWVENGKVVFKKTIKDNERGFIVKKYLSEIKNSYKQVDSLFGVDNQFMNQVATKELILLLEDLSFTFPKPITFIYNLIKFATQPNDIILDFFAGSGTTGDAVIQLNAEDIANGKEGNRKYILVQIPEKIDPKKNKIAYDFVKNELNVDEPTIFEITKERLVRAGKKIHNEQQSNLFTAEVKLDCSFKIFETIPIWENFNFEATEFDSQLKIFDESTLSPEDLQTILLTWKTYDNIPLSQNLESIDFNGYTGYYGKGKLYLVNTDFQTKNLKAILEKIDEDKIFNPTSIIVFGYNFANNSKNLREIAENIASYANKKNLSIDFIIRY